jgi:TolB-like protein/Tfp pilus assembly protein PilF
VRTQLERILSSPHFAAAERSKRFLRFIVDETLADRRENLKEYTLAVEVFDRDADFDTSTNPIVRVEASRLRRRLEHYYLTLGREDPVLIEIPRGTYVPAFQSKVDVLHIQEDLAALDSEEVPDFGGGLAGGPWIVVLPFTNLDESEDVFANGITAEIITALSRFRDFHVIARDTSSNHNGKEGAVRIGRQLGVGYILQGSTRREEKRLRIHAEVASGTTGEVLWAERYERDLNVDSIFDIQEEIASHVVATVAQPGGVIVRPEAARARRKATESLDAYDAILLFHDYDARLSPEAHGRALAAIESALQTDPDVASLHAVRAVLYVDMFRFGFNLRETRERALQEASDSSHQAVQLDPLNPKAHHALFLTHFCHGDLDAFRKAGKRALELNPNDTATLADFGLHLILIEDFDLGRLLMKAAMMLNPEPPDWYWFAFFSLHFSRGEFDEALDMALRAQNEDFYWVHFMHAAAYRKLGMMQEARAAVKRLLALYPDFPSHARREIECWMSPERAGETLDLLRDVGLASR